MKIAVIGTGYVGLVSGACFSELGLHVTCIDNNKKKVHSLKKGHIPIYEPGLEEIVIRNHKAGHLVFIDDIKQGISGAEIIFIAVGTPTNERDGSADLSHVFAAVEECALHLQDHAVIVTKSTVPVGTGQMIKSIIKRIRPRLTFDVVSNPEFLREGCAVTDFMNPERIIIGVESEHAKKMMRLLYQSFMEKNVPIVFTGVETSELTKYACNAFLATKLGFINEIADICERVGANIIDVVKGMGYDHRIGTNYLKPGPGYGGSCLPKDTLALRKIAQDVGIFANITDTVIEANAKRKLAMAEKIIEACGGDIAGKTIAVLGVAFKANTDDMRDSPALTIIPKLQEAGADIKAYDPVAMEQAKPLFEGHIKWSKDLYSALEGADAAVIITEWNEFKELDLDKAKQALNRPLMIDLRNLFSLARMRAAGFIYISIGRV